MTSIYRYSENSLIEEKLKEYTPFIKLNEYVPKKKFYKIMHIDMNKSMYKIGSSNEIKDMIYENDEVSAVFINPVAASDSIKMETDSDGIKNIRSSRGKDFLFSSHPSLPREEV